MKPSVLLNMIVALEIILGPITSQAHDEKPNQKNLPVSEQLSLPNIEYSKPEIDLLSKWHEYADHLEKNQGAIIKNTNDVREHDTWHFTQQYIEIYGDEEKVSYHLNFNDYIVQIPEVHFSQLKVGYDETTDRLYFEASLGADQNGRNGKIVARHFIEGLTVAKYIQDKEILSIIDRSGKLHVIDMHFVSSQIFKSPIPVFKNLWQPIQPYDTSNLKIGYLTRGTIPFNIENLESNVVVMRDNQQKAILKSGDLYIISNAKPVALLNREVIYDQISQASEMIRNLTLLLSPKNENFDALKSTLERLNEFENTALNESATSMPIDIRKALENIREDQVHFLSEQANKNLNRATRQRDQFNYQEWLRSFNDIKASAVRENEKDNLDQDRLIEDLEQNFSKHIKPIEVQNVLANKKISLARKLTHYISYNISTRTLGWAMVAGAVGYFSFPFFYSSSAALQQVRILSWAWGHLYFPVLQDASYRSLLLKSITGVMALWPLLVASSAIAGQQLRYLTENMKNGATRTARIVRDLARNWGSLDNFQRINALAFRGVALLTYPYLRAATEKILRQKLLFTAFDHGINPLSRIQLDDGKTAFIGVGLNNKNNDEKLRLQSLIVEQREQTRFKAYEIAAFVVAEKYNLDPATILMMAEGNKSLDPQKIKELLNNPTKRQEWELIAEKIYSEFKSINLRKLSPQELVDYYGYAKAIGKSLSQESKLSKDLRTLRIRFRQMGRKAYENMPFVSLGIAQANFLRKLFPEKEFSNQLRDNAGASYTLSAFVVANIGPRADLTHPEHLSADPNGFLWTSRPHWSDQFNQFYNIFFSGAASSALVYQKLKVEDEDLYQPIENKLYQSTPREQALGSSIKSLFYDLRPSNSDLGGIALKRLFNRFGTLQASLTSAALFRFYIMDQSVPLVLKAYVLYFFASQWFTGYIWDPVYSSTVLARQRVREQNDRLQNARFLISQASKSLDEKDAQRKFKEGYKQLYALYAEDNPNAIRELTELMRNIDSDDEINRYMQTQADQIKATHDKFSSQEMNYIGLVVGLAEAIQSNDENEIKLRTAYLKDTICKKCVASKEIDELNANSLLRFSISNPPTYTKANQKLPWVMNWFAAIASIVAGTPLAVIASDPHLLNQHQLLLHWFFESAGLYATYYLALGREPWKIYLKKWDEFIIKREINKNLEKDFSSNVFDEDLLHPTSREKQIIIYSCQGVF